MSVSCEILSCIPAMTSTLFTKDYGCEIRNIMAEFSKLNKFVHEDECQLPVLEHILDLCNSFENEIISLVENSKLVELMRSKRQAFSSSCFIKAYVILRISQENLDSALKALDLALLIGVPLEGWDLAAAIDVILQKQDLNRRFSNDKRTLVPCVDCSSDEIDSDDEGPKWRYFSCVPTDNSTPDDIPSEELPSVEAFRDMYLEEGEPVKLVGCMDGWPALVKWKYLGYLNRLAGVRTVPVELGDYSRGGRVRLVTLAEYLDELCDGRTVDQCGYLAQHQLFDQVPRFEEDVRVPDYCALTDLEDITSNVWLGPANTCSPLHTDPNNNFLCQVFGRKMITLFAPTDGENLYPGEDGLSNTSQVDIFNPDLERFPEFEQTTPLVCTLHPGEMLFIPFGWWHAVRALDVSCSVNFFF